MGSRYEGRFNDKVALVTGAAGTIGRVIARRLADEGARVVLVDVDGGRLDELAAELAAERADAVVAVRADVSDESDVKRSVSTAVERFGGLDVLVNNAGIEGVAGTVADLPVEELERVLRVNVRGVFLATQHAVPAMRARGGGAIVNISSIAGLLGGPGVVAYSTSKHAVIGLTRCSALSLVTDGIRVNAACPGPIEGRMMDSICSSLAPEDPRAVRDALLQRVPAGHYGAPEDVAALVLFLASDEARFITGSVHSVDGGMTAA